MNLKTIALLLLGLLVGYVSGCRTRGIEHVSAEEFQSLVTEGQRANTAYWLQAIGATSNRAYIEQGELITTTGAPRIKVLWTESQGLPEGYLNDWANLDAPGAGEPGSAVRNLLDKIEADEEE